jgi:hypothetical protein
MTASAGGSAASGIAWKRTLRTPSSERFLAIRNGQEVAAVDIHYLPNGHAAGTVILLDEHSWDEPALQSLLQSLDEDFLPEVDLARGTLTYTVVTGRVTGNYEASEKE